MGFVLRNVDLFVVAVFFYVHFFDFLAIFYDIKLIFLYLSGGREIKSFLSNLIKDYNGNSEKNTGCYSFISLHYLFASSFISTFYQNFFFFYNI